VHTNISAPFVDTKADDLVWTLDHPVVEPLAARTCRVRGATVELRVLGASHQTVVRSAGGELVETVACLPGVEGGLPEQGEPTETPAGHYRFSSSVHILSHTDLTRRVDVLHREVADTPGGLLVTFPGDPLAVTALHLAPDPGGPVRWTTWHVYPQSGELVTTAATLTP